jgi:type II secretory pathway component GspD/PulD (secretin)
MEGEQAFIDVGKQIPIVDFGVGQTRSGTIMEQQTRYAAATTGFFARPLLSGDTVTIEISPYQTTVEGSATPPAFNVQSLHTTVSGKLGEWIAIGASTADTAQENKSAIVYSTGRRGEQDRRILLRVTVMP